MTDPPVAEVEAAARAICEMDVSTDTWELIETPYLRWYNNAARAALVAAAEVREGG